MPCASCCSNVVPHPEFPICPCSTGCFAPALLGAASFPSVIFLFCCPSCPGFLLTCLAPTLMIFFALFSSVFPALIPPLCVFLSIPPALGLFSQHLMSFLKRLRRDTISLSNCSAAQWSVLSRARWKPLCSAQFRPWLNSCTGHSYSFSTTKTLPVMPCTVMGS